MSQKRSDTVAQFNLDEINSTKSLEFADLFLVFNDAFELGNSIRSFIGYFLNLFKILSGLIKSCYKTNLRNKISKQMV